MTWPRRHGRGLAVALVAGIFLAASGAFGSGEAPAWVRFPYWIGLMLGGSVFGMTAAAVMQRRGWFGTRPFVASAVLALGMALPMTVVVWAATSVVFGMPMSWRSLAWFFPPVLLVSAAMTTLNFFIQRREAAPSPAAGSAAAAAKFLERLPLKLRGADLYAVEAEDHYLRLHTSRGSDLILMRLSDAIAELDGLEGAQTHRSWWVAKAAVRDARAADGRAVLTLANGVEVPVSRRYAPALRQARWW